MEEPEQRFFHLLNPLRDLTRNWEVDVAAHLEEYLEELDNIVISFDGGKTTMNFAEAALLIQGSACIYSKKVEYLYSLVYQTLDMISDKKRSQKVTDVGQEGVDSDTSFAYKHNEEEFLSLDDIQSSSNINLHNNPQNMLHTSIMPLIPMCLIPTDEVERQGTPLYSQKGELLASRKDFRMNTSTPHHTGVFMLELSGLSSVDGTTIANTALNALHCQDAIDEEFSALQKAIGSNAGNGGGDNGNNVGFLPLADADGHDDMDDLPPLEELDPRDDPAAAEEVIDRQQVRPENKGYMLRERPIREFGEKAPPTKPQAVDPWGNMDIFAEGPPEKPFVKGRTFSLPPGLDPKATKQKRKRAVELMRFNDWFTKAYKAMAAPLWKKTSLLSFSELEELYWTNMRKAMATQLKIQKKLLLAGKPHAQDITRADSDDDGDDIGGGGDGGNQGQGARGESIPGVREIGRDPDFQDLPYGLDDYGDADDLNTTPHDVIGDVVPLQIGNEEQLKFEELVIRNVEIYMAASAGYAQDTALSRRIRDWDEMIMPTLQLQEDRGSCDIGSYCDRVIGRFERNSQSMRFADIVKDHEPFEACRYMLACLQLANDGNVAVGTTGVLHEALDTMELTLLSRELVRERIETYQAPSLARSAR
ncbi:condensin-2 complex subunit H2 [Petromyzon marinus]|uniref:condensin-2 complex subunit H2 n=1 Tax=Petromyzon marinus TaxID=7757 RepID=UPI003F72A96B